MYSIQDAPFLIDLKKAEDVLVDLDRAEECTRERAWYPADCFGLDGIDVSVVSLLRRPVYLYQLYLCDHAFRAHLFDQIRQTLMQENTSLVDREECTTGFQLLKHLVPPVSDVDDRKMVIFRVSNRHSPRWVWQEPGVGVIEVQVVLS